VGLGGVVPPFCQGLLGGVGGGDGPGLVVWVGGGLGGLFGGWVGVGGFPGFGFGGGGDLPPPKLFNPRVPPSNTNK